MNRDLDLWAIVVRWDEPEAGMSAHGPYATRADAECQLPTRAFREQYENSGVLPDDVVIEIQKLART